MAAPGDFHFHGTSAAVMLGPMTERVFLGWDRPFLELAAAWLLERRDELPLWLVLVPTSQAGRRLREALAEMAGGALLSPKIATPGSLLATPDPAVATDWMERVAWLEVFEGIEDWENYLELFPQPPEREGDWADGLAGELTSVRRSLQENGLTLADAARMLAKSVEAGRWETLARLENRMEQKLRAWGLQSRSRVLAKGVALPQGITRVVLAGVTETPPLLEKALLVWEGRVTALIAAPENEAEAFSEIGGPLDCWARRIMPWPASSRGSVRLVADPRQEAAEALRAVVETQTPSSEVALGTADTAAGDELAHVFTRAGWPAFHPAAQPVAGGLMRWMKIWSSWLKDPLLSTVADLLAMPETAALAGGSREIKAAHLSRLRNSWMIMRPDDLRQRLRTADFRSESQRAGAAEVLGVVETLERWRAEFLHEDFVTGMEKLSETMAAFSDETSAETAMIGGWLTDAAPVMRQVRRDAAFWIDLMLDVLPAPAPQPPDGRVIDVQGWLELLYEPGRHLVLCGMNEGKVPARDVGDPWLGEAARSLLGLRGNAGRAARDAFLYQTMLEARRSTGRVDVLCAKTGPGGESLLPSRLLLAAARDELPERVKFLFQGVEPPEAGMRWHADWKWRPRAVEISKRLSVTSFSAWLACPFRFYLKHALGMQAPEPGRVEWNARDFGTIAHDILERWGRDESARDLTDAAALHDWFAAALDTVVAEWFDRHPPLAVRVQTEALRQRLGWLARVQAGLRADGWQVVEVERKFEIEVGGFIIAGKIDRIDLHAETGALRVIDYKTGGVAGVEGEHRKKITTNATLPAHLPADSPALHAVEKNGKFVEHRWTNLQLPLYALALHQQRGELPSPCYFTLGATEPDVGLNEWADFSENDLATAKDCAEWIVSRISSGVFWPPAEKTRYDDYAPLASGRTLEEMCEPPLSQPGSLK
jgi:ATP-dependent helicase/nuclease subunit B